MYTNWYIEIISSFKKVKYLTVDVLRLNCLNRGTVLNFPYNLAFNGVDITWTNKYCREHLANVYLKYPYSICQPEKNDKQF